MKSIWISILIGAIVSVVSITGHADPIVIMYGGLGGHAGGGGSTNDGSLAIVNQTTGAVTVVGPTGASRISGLDFDSTGTLFGATQNNVAFPPPTLKGPSNLVRLNPLTGASLSSVAITDSGTPISIADLAVQPGTDTLYGISGDIGGQGAGELFTIDKTTGAATLVGATDDFFASIAFAPDGTLYMFAQTLTFDTNGNPIFGPPELETLNPSTAAELTSVATPQFYGAFGIRPTDGVLFAGNGDGGAGTAALFTVNPTTGAATEVGPTGKTFVGDIAFQIPEPSTMMLVCLGLLLLNSRAWSQRRAT
jgi:hypothetical protein